MDRAHFLVKNLKFLNAVLKLKSVYCGLIWYSFTRYFILLKSSSMLKFCFAFIKHTDTIQFFFFVCFRLAASRHKEPSADQRLDFTEENYLSRIESFKNIQ